MSENPVARAIREIRRAIQEPVVADLISPDVREYWRTHPDPSVAPRASSLSVEAPQLDVERAAWDEGYEAGKTNAEELALMRPVGRGRFTEPDSEHCRECRLPVGIWYEAIGDLWAKVTGRNDGSGILCAGCFDVQAAKKGIGVRWEAHHEAG